MHARGLLASVAVASLLHIGGVAAEDAAKDGKDKERPEASEPAAAKRPPVPSAKPAVPAMEAKPADGGKAAETPHLPPRPATGPLPLGTGERAFNAPECAWTGKRVVSLLERDDVDPANQFTRFYSMFGCPAQHLGITLGCVVAWNGPNETKREDRIDACWVDPGGKRREPATAAAKTGEEPKPGSDDKPPAKN
jgi:hypothetical protein